MCVSREKLRHSSLYVAQMVQIKWGGLSHHAKHTFMQMWGETCYLRVFDVGGLLWTNACQGYFFFLFYEVMSRMCVRKNSCCISTKIGLENVEGRSKAFRIMRYQACRVI